MEIASKPIVIIGSVNTDMVMRTERMPLPGETILGDEFMMNLGGKGANQAVAVAKLGGKSLLIGKVGNDVFGTQALETFFSVGVDTSYIGITDDSPSGAALITVDHEGENSIVVASGANKHLTIEDIDAAETVIASASMLLMQLECPIETVTHAARVAHRHGVSVVLNPAPAPSEPLPTELLSCVDIIIPNETEAQIITGVEINDGESQLEAINKLHAMGIKRVIITLGSKGAMVCEEGDCQLVESVKVNAVDTTAAGDTFCGALCVELSRGESLINAVLFATRAAAIAVTRVGAISSIPSIEEIETLIPIKKIS